VRAAVRFASAALSFESLPQLKPIKTWPQNHTAAGAVSPWLEFALEGLVEDGGEQGAELDGGFAL